MDLPGATACLLLLVDIMLELGYVPGFFYDAKVMAERVSVKLGFAIYPAFVVEEDDHIPLLDYYCLATDLAWKVMNHPTAKEIKNGMILFPRM